MSCGRTGPKWRCMAMMHSATFGLLPQDLDTVRSVGWPQAAYQSILESDVKPSVWQLKLWKKGNLIQAQQKIFNRMALKEKSQVFAVPSLNLDLCLIEMLWWDLWYINKCLCTSMIRSHAVKKRRPKSEYIYIHFKVTVDALSLLPDYLYFHWTVNLHPKCKPELNKLCQSLNIKHYNSFSIAARVN